MQSILSCTVTYSHSAVAKVMGEHMAPKEGAEEVTGKSCSLLWQGCFSGFPRGAAALRAPVGTFPLLHGLCPSPCPSNSPEGWLSLGLHVDVKPLALGWLRMSRDAAAEIRPRHEQLTCFAEGDEAGSISQTTASPAAACPWTRYWLRRGSSVMRVQLPFAPPSQPQARLLSRGIPL